MRKQIIKLLFLSILSNIGIIANAQLVGTEQTASVTVYQGIFVVNGDHNTYYPVVFKYGDPNKINHLRIFRSYNEAGPDVLSPTHRGGLSLEIDVNYGGWGGAAYDWRVEDLRQQYHTTFAGATLGMHYYGFIVWMRGGGFQYHYESEKPANIQVAYSTSEFLYDHPTINSYDVYAPPAKTEIDWATINAHKNDHWDYIKDKPSEIGGTWLKSGSDINYSAGNVSIGTTTIPTGYKLAVNGKIIATEIKVETGWADFVFEPDYKLMGLKELKTYILKNKHLPEIPSEAEVKENGISVGEMNAKLLQKIEELTLYTIDQQELINNQQEQLEKQSIAIENLIKGMETQNKRIEELE